MVDQQHNNYQRVAKAIEYIHSHVKAQPSLNEIAAHVGVSPSHFQRLFTQWAGVSPKKFIQYLTVGYAKQLLQTEQPSIADTAYELGLSGTSRLHDLFVNIEAMTPGEFKNGGEALGIQYRFAPSLFGKLIVASTNKGICHLAFVENEADAQADLARRFPKADFQQGSDTFQQAALQAFGTNEQALEQIKLHLKGTPFQLKVWAALLAIPTGSLSTYGSVAEQIAKPKAARAVGTAIGSNPVGFLIPCHRVIQTTGHLGGYMWGTTRKSAMIGWEAAAREQ